MKRIILVILTGLFIVINTNHLQISKSIKITPKYRSVGIEYVENNYFPIEDKKVEAKIRWLALNIYYEARSENELGQRAVAWVVLNRVQSVWWPNTIKEVITQKHQFSWYYKGKEKKTPKDRESWRKAQQIARVVYKNYINGKLDPTNGADHYHASYVSPNWAKSTKQTIKVGKHLFYDLFKEPQKMIEWGIVEPTNPFILGQANLPKPLHGINPRTIMGRSNWMKFREITLLKQNFCTSCGVIPGILELHESYKIDYNKYIMEVEDYVPLCRDCHSFIHSGLLKVRIDKKAITVTKAKDILNKGFNIARKYDFPVFLGTVILANKLQVNTHNIKTYKPRQKEEGWGKWVLLYNNKAYRGLTKQQWLETINTKNVT